MSVILENREYFFKLREVFRAEVYGEKMAMKNNQYYLAYCEWLKKTRNITVIDNYLVFPSEKALTMFLLKWV